MQMQYCFQGNVFANLKYLLHNIHGKFWCCFFSFHGIWSTRIALLILTTFMVQVSGGLHSLPDCPNVRLVAFAKSYALSPVLTLCRLHRPHLFFWGQFWNDCQRLTVANRAADPTCPWLEWSLSMANQSSCLQPNGKLLASPGKLGHLVRNTPNIAHYPLLPAQVALSTCKMGNADSESDKAGYESFWWCNLVPF